MNRILIAEDEPRIAARLEKGLRASGFITAVATETDDVFLMALAERFDLLLLDLDIGNRNGSMLLKKLRDRGAMLPIIIFADRDDVSDPLGIADDCLTKPFRFEELLSLIRLHLGDRLKMVMKEEMELTINDITLNWRTRRVRLSDREIELSAREFALLETLLRDRGKVMSRDRLLDGVWGYDYDPGSNIVDVYVGYLRKKLGSEWIETVRGMGYRLRESIEVPV